MHRILTLGIALAVLVVFFDTIRADIAPPSDFYECTIADWEQDYEECKECDPDEANTEEGSCDERFENTAYQRTCYRGDAGTGISVWCRDRIRRSDSEGCAVAAPYAAVPISGLLLAVVCFGLGARLIRRHSL